MCVCEVEARTCMSPAASFQVFVVPSANVYDPLESMVRPPFSVSRHCPIPSKCSNANPSGLIMSLWQLWPQVPVSVSMRWRLVCPGWSGGMGGMFAAGGPSVAHTTSLFNVTPRRIEFGSASFALSVRYGNCEK